MSVTTVKHVHKDGARFHVVSWYGVEDRNGHIHGLAHCSEPRCEINARARAERERIRSIPVSASAIRAAREVKG